MDPSGPWRTWRTAHFRIHAHAPLAAVVERAAREAERSYRLLADELKPPRGTIDLVVADNADLPNGSATPFPSNRLTVFVTPPMGTVSLDDYDDWFRFVLSHELTHIFHLDRAAGVWGVLQAVFGRAPILFPNAYQPAWVREGLATYYESRLTGAGRAQGHFHRQLLAAAARGDRWPRPNDISLASPRWPAGFQPYAWGADFFALQRALHGDSVIPGFIARTARQLWPLAVSRSLTGAGGAPLDDAWRRLRDEVPTGDGAGPPGEVLRRGLRSEPHPRVSPDGSRVAYLVADGRAVERLEVRTLPDLRLQAAQRTNGAAEFAWVGDTLYVTQLEFTSPVTVYRDLYVWLPGWAPRRLSRGARLDHPFAAPGGGAGVVDLGRRGSALAVRDGGEVRSFAAPAAAAWSRVAPSPGGEWLAGARHEDGRWDIVQWRPDRPDEVRRVTHDDHLDEDPVWTPDGRALLFVSDRTGLPQVYAFDPVSGEVRRVTDEPAGAREPAPLPGGGLLYVTLLHDGFALVRRPAVTGVPVPAERDPVRAFQPPEPVPVTATGYRPWAALRPHFWIPVGHDQGATGTFFGAATAGADPVGRTVYGAAATVSGSPLRSELLVAVRYRRWRHMGLDVSLEQTWRGLRGRLPNGEVVPLSERDRVAGAGLTYSWRRWRTVFAARAGAEVEQTTLTTEPAGRAALPSIPTLAGGVVSAQAGHVSRPPLAVSLEDGVVVRALARRRWAIAESGWGEELQGSVAAYLALPLPGFAHWVLAARVAAGRSGGPRPSVFSIGGTSGDALEVVPGIALGGGRRTFPLRGYPPATLFTRAVVSAGELRVPVFLLSKGLWVLPVVVDRISLTLFAEAGGGWVAGEPAAPARYRDVGAEAVLDLGVSYDVPLRARVGWAVPLTDGLGARRGDPRVYLAFGPGF